MGTRSEPAKGKADQAGFTLLELLLVLGVLALASVFTMPLLSRPAGDAALVATARRIASDMRLARAAAIRDNQERTMTIDVARRSFRVDALTPPSTIARGITLDLVVAQKDLMFHRGGKLRFHADGSSTGGNIILRADGRMMSVELDWMTGHTRVRRGR